jgi:hypothetical protein
LLPALHDLLKSATEPCSLEGFARALFRQRLTVRLKNCARLAGDPSLPGRLRGAFGRELAETASPQALAGEPCAWSPPCAFDVLFRSQGRVNRHTDVPKPWLIAVDPAGADLEVSLTLFGLASEWMPAAAELFTRALRNRVNWHRLTEATGISTADFPGGGSSRFRAEFTAPDPGRIEGRTLVTVEGVDRDLEAAPDIAMLLDFLSPAAVTGHNLADRPAALFHEAGSRLEGIARWHGLSLAEETDWRFLKKTGQSLDIYWQDPLPLSWTRRSRRQDREIRMSGVAGQLVIQDIAPPDGRRPASRAAAPGAAGGGDGEVMALIGPTLQDLWPVLVLGEAVHLGADTAFGCGRYQLLAS